MEAAARAAADGAGWIVRLLAAVAVAFIFHGKHLPDATAGRSTRKKIKLSFGCK
jgi:hypothetical protein